MSHLPLATVSEPETAGLSWARSWGASPQAHNDAVGADFESLCFTDATLRQVVRISGGGRQVRIRLSNEFGTAPLAIGAASIALAAPGGALEPGTERVLSFGSRTTALIPAGAALLSDAVELPLSALSKLAINIYMPGSVEGCTCHGLALETGWVMPGDATAALVLPAEAKLLPPVRVVVSAVDVASEGTAKTIVVLGDSRTDGAGSTPDADRRWPDILAERLHKRGGAASYVSNQGISGNRVLNAGIGASALARFERDVLSTPGLAYVVVAVGGNDIAISFAPHADAELAAFLEVFPGAPVSVEDVIAGYRQLLAQAHAQGVKIYATTIPPYQGSPTFSLEGEAARQALNAWIRNSGAFDAVLDFDAVWRDPAQPSQIGEEWHEGDYVHGSDAGYKALADSIDLNLFT